MGQSFTRGRSHCSRDSQKEIYSGSTSGRQAASQRVGKGNRKRNQSQKWVRARSLLELNVGPREQPQTHESDLIAMYSLSQYKVFQARPDPGGLAGSAGACLRHTCTSWIEGTTVVLW